MQSIATENNLSETAYFVPADTGYDIRWFTPAGEVDLCGHATLASAYVIFNILGFSEQVISFKSKSGLLSVRQNDDWLEMNFPSQAAASCATPSQILNAFDDEPVECLQAQDYVVVFADENSILNANPDISLLAELDLRGVAITAKGKEYDFVTQPGKQERRNISRSEESQISL